MTKWGGHVSSPGRVAAEESACSLLPCENAGVAGPFHVLGETVNLYMTSTDI